jgi:hypothetical protein
MPDDDICHDDTPCPKCGEKDCVSHVRNIDDIYANCSLTIAAAEFAESIKPAAPPDLSQYRRATQRQKNNQNETH